MLHEVSDSPKTAHELGQLLKGRNMIVNLIPWNPIYSPGMQLEAPEDKRVAEFQRIVREEHGIFCTVRQEMGQDISGAANLLYRVLCPPHCPNVTTLLEIGKPCILICTKCWASRPLSACQLSRSLS